MCKVSQKSLLQQTQTLDWLGYIGVSRGHSVPTPMVPVPRHLAQVEHGCTDQCSHLGALEGLASGEGAAPGASAGLQAWPLSVSKHGLCPPRCGDDVSRVPLSPQPVASEAGEILSGGHRASRVLHSFHQSPELPVGCWAERRSQKDKGSKPPPCKRDTLVTTGPVSGRWATSFLGRNHMGTGPTLFPPVFPWFAASFPHSEL